MRGSRFYDRIYEAAERMVQQPDADEVSFAAAIAMLGTASETAVQLTIEAIIREKELGPIAKAAVGWIRPGSYNVRTEPVRNTWNAIIGDKVEDEKTFWPEYLEHVKREQGGTYRTY